MLGPVLELDMRNRIYFWCVVLMVANKHDMWWCGVGHGGGGGRRLG